MNGCGTASLSSNNSNAKPAVAWPDLSATASLPSVNCANEPSSSIKSPSTEKSNVVVSPSPSLDGHSSHEFSIPSDRTPIRRSSSNTLLNSPPLSGSTSSKDSSSKVSGKALSTRVYKDHDPFLLVPSAGTEFEYIEDNEYKGGSRAAIVSEEIMACECRYYPDRGYPRNQACGENSDCINRLLLVECGSNCPTQSYCLNRRFQEKDYSKISIFETPGKGYGLVAQEDIAKGQFIFEYVGEVLTRNAFIKRSEEYSRVGQSHFYFMTLTTDEIIDAARKGNLSRFMNHSCNPNCQTQKWIVGKKMRVGLFALHPIAKGGELTFDYNFETYGANPQPCRCGEPNCRGIIGTQKKGSNEDGTLDESGVVTKKSSSSKKFMRTETAGLDNPADVPMLMKNILQTEQAGSLLRHLRVLGATNSISCLKKFLQLHGLKIIHALLLEYKKESSIIYYVVTLLSKLPVATKNSIDDSKLEPRLKKLLEHEDAVISSMASSILEKWSHLESVFRIPKASEGATSDSPSPPFPPSTDDQSVLQSHEDHFPTPLSPQIATSHVDVFDFTVPDSYKSHEQPVVMMSISSTPLDTWKQESDTLIYPPSPSSAKVIPVHGDPDSSPSPELNPASFEETQTQIQDAIAQAKASMEHHRSVAEKNAEDADLKKDLRQNLRERISEFVIRYLSKYKSQISNEDFKRIARKLSHTLLDKEQRDRSGRNDHSDYIDKATKKKMKKFVYDYLHKLGYKRPDKLPKLK